MYLIKALLIEEHFYLQLKGTTPCVCVCVCVYVHSTYTQIHIYSTVQYSRTLNIQTLIIRILLIIQTVAVTEYFITGVRSSRAVQRSSVYKSMAFEQIV